ncbi:hypothetical protein ACFQ07_32300 [Actinomadura adrarensis]|uniref:Uncharacterized protein n=1 Tax=Actinomadura adrarensis TaxID=1819600 RepID=A0ABW3CT44_9ACTN
MNGNLPGLSPLAARVHGSALALAPVLLLCSTIAFIYEGGINDGVVGGTIGVWSTFALGIGFVGLFRTLEPASPRLMPVLLPVAVIAFTAGAMFNVQAMYLAAYGNDLLTDITEGGAADIAPIGVFAFLPWGLLAPLTFVLTGLLLWRTRTAPKSTAALLVLGGLLFVASRPERIEPLALAADATLILALVPLGWSLATGRHPTPRTASAPA